ncbi:MAG: DnaJ domain-containing protein [Dehalococcoidales bacterium]
MFRIIGLVIILLVVIVVFRRLRYIAPARNNTRNQSQKDYYKILQVHPTAEQEVIKAAYDRLAKKYHPDVNKEPSSLKTMKDLNEAYEVLGDLANRRLYHQEWLNQQK